MSESEFEPELYRFPEFFDRLEGRGLLRARDAVESETEIDGMVYHHRGVQVPAETVTFLWNPDDETPPEFRLDAEGIGERGAWATFDATATWDVYVMLYDGGAVIAWMSDREFDHDEADEFSSKALAIRAGRFSFAVFFLFGPDWIEREEWAQASSAPALLQLGDGNMITPESVEEFYEPLAAVPEELRRPPESPPDHLALRSAGFVETD